MHKKKIQNSKGITLIALIITIVILIILTAVAVDIVVDGNIFDTSKDAVSEANNKTTQEQNKVDEMIGILENEERRKCRHVWGDWEIIVPATCTQNGLRQRTCTLCKLIQYGIIPCEHNYVNNECTKCGEEKPNNIPTLKVDISDITETTAKITAIGEDKDEEILKYTLKVDGKTYGPDTTSIWDLTELKENETYTYEVTVTDGRTPVTATGSFKMLLNNTMPTITATVTGITPTTAQITAIGSDVDGDKLTYTLDVNGETYKSNTGIFDVSGLTEKTTYSYVVKVNDGFVDATETGSFTTTPSNTAPVITANVDYKSGKTTTQFTIQMSATDVDGDSLTYTLYAATSQNGTYYEVGTATGNAGASTTIAVNKINGTSLSQYTQYWWKLKVTDGKETKEEAAKSLRTYCSGSNTCNSATKCTKVGYVSQDCPSCVDR